MWITSPKIMANDPSSTSSNNNDIISSSHTSDNSMTLCSISFKKVHREHLSPMIHLPIWVFFIKQKIKIIGIEIEKMYKIDERAYLWIR